LFRVWLRPAALVMLVYLGFLLIVQTGLASFFGYVGSFLLTSAWKLLLLATIILVVLAIERER
jgi:hypothetical protein